MNNILVLGANGQLGQEIHFLSQKDISRNYFFTSKEDLDIRNFEDVNKYINQNTINTIINCSAYTDVDKAENDKDKANDVNNLAVGNLALITKKYKLRLVHISTDYVFDGENYKPYLEKDITNPHSIYGSTKRKGEKAILKIDPSNTIIIRTSWVYSSYGSNFVKTMLRLGKIKEELGIINDQIGTPTYARDLAAFILKILSEINNNKVQIYNYTNEGVASWFDFAKAIFEMKETKVGIYSINSSEYKTKAKRPYYSVLCKKKTKNTFDVVIPYWRDSLKECLRLL